MTAAPNGAARPSTPQRGLLFVNANDLAWTGEPRAQHARRQRPRPLHRAVRRLSRRRPDGQWRHPPPSLRRDSIPPHAPSKSPSTIQKGAGRMPGFPNLRPPASARAGAVRDERRFARRASTPPQPSPFDMKYRFTGYNKFLDPDGYPAVAPPWGTLNAINLEHRRISPGRFRSANIPSSPPRA